MGSRGPEEHALRTQEVGALGSTPRGEEEAVELGVMSRGGEEVCEVQAESWRERCARRGGETADRGELLLFSG